MPKATQIPSNRNITEKESCVMDDDLIRQIRDGWLPLFACDQLLWAALRLMYSERQVLDDLGELFFAEEAAPEPRSLFQYLFTPARGPTTETRDSVAGFRLRNAEERLWYVRERRAAVMTSGSADLKILDSHEIRS
jgi:hypothetical protein